jgi:hypothetical protein
MLWPGNRREQIKLGDTRLARTAAALEAAGVAVEPAVYADEFVDEVRAQLLAVDGVLVWVNPIERGRDRTVLDAMLRDIADHGVFVSAHPDVILAMGTKEVLYATRMMGWGCDTRLYLTRDAMAAQLPSALAAGKPRVLKQYRGNGGNGVWKVVALANDHVRIRHALRDSPEEDMSTQDFVRRCEPYFANGGRVIDQAYQDRLPDGMVRAYLVGDRVAGFGEQLQNALLPANAPGEPLPQAGPRLYYPPTRADFQPLKLRLETEWLPQMCTLLGVARESLPVIWDADFLYGAKAPDGSDTYVLCEINISCVYPFPDEALQPLANEVVARLR